MSNKRKRRDRYSWQQLVEQQAQSGLNAAQFCREQDVRYASFMNWRKRLSVETVRTETTPLDTFVELTGAPLEHQSESPPATLSDTAVCVELSLGAGIELRITRQS